MKEKIILSLIAALLGLFVAGGAFYIYQMTREVDPNPRITNSKNSPTQTPENSDFLVVDNPTDEAVVDKRTVTISGKTTPGALIIVSSESADQVVKPSQSGNFTLTHTVNDEVNIIKITAFFANGQEKTVTKTVTFTTEDF